MKVRARHRVGFTLVELLVVIAIIGILIGLLLPAVQMAREAASRTACTNNLKQIGLALQTYNTEMNAFPAGGTGCSNGYYGSSWWISVLPWLEETSIYDRYDKTGRESGRSYQSTGWIMTEDGAANRHNFKVLNKVPLPIAKCASSPIPALYHYRNDFWLFKADYVAISGSSDRPLADLQNGYYSVGIISGSGILTPNAWIRMKSITDGTTKTMVVGEQSDYCYSADGSPSYCSSSCLHGFSMSIANSFPGGDNRAFNMATIRYRISKDASLLNSNGCGANSPLQSAHPGGANVLMADGHVRFLNENTNIRALKAMADRDDGQDFDAEI
ncbi:MAG: DUF1559 domain-containing protein [Planctomycetota bacterium]|nr:DUF1559 domain-containing protein [Planctomycetota bacterium]MDA1177617.1 DUF1559 domain-containing protein [Planctomycetota bacterium]